jgi:hypothetical protein
MTLKYRQKWENDASSQPLSDKAKEYVRELTFSNLHKQGLTPDQLRDKEMAKDYAAWLAAQPQQ